jgi:hypothetical protein
MGLQSITLGDEKWHHIYIYIYISFVLFYRYETKLYRSKLTHGDECDFATDYTYTIYIWQLFFWRGHELRSRFDVF